MTSLIKLVLLYSMVYGDHHHHHHEKERCYEAVKDVWQNVPPVVHSDGVAHPQQESEGRTDAGRNPPLGDALLSPTRRMAESICKCER